MTPAEPDLVELTRALEAERPAVTPRFAREMDAWADDGFRGRGPRVADREVKVHRPGRRWGGRLAFHLSGVATIALCAVVLFAVIGRSGGADESASSGSGDGGGGGSVAADERAAPQRSSESGPSTAFDSAGNQALPAPPRANLRLRRGRSVERSASLALATPPDELERVAAGVSRVTDQVGGYVARSAVDARSGSGTATFALRVPASRLTQALADLSDLASVRSRTQASVDITATLRGAAERLEEARAERRGLLRRLERAPDAPTRARLRTVGRRIAAAKAAVARADRRADLARVDVTLAGEPGAGSGAGGSARDDGRWTPGDALRDAARILEVVAGGALVALAVALPLMLLGGPLLLAGRHRTRRRREAALDAI